jgi:hypothetical protein
LLDWVALNNFSHKGVRWLDWVALNNFSHKGLRWFDWVALNNFSHKGVRWFDWVALNNFSHKDRSNDQIRTYLKNYTYLLSAAGKTLRQRKDTSDHVRGAIEPVLGYHHGQPARVTPKVLA